MVTGIPSCRPWRRLAHIAALACALASLVAAPAAAQDSLFDRAFGKLVDATPFVCTTAEGCQAGTASAAGGALNVASGVAVAGEEVYVSERDNDRVSVFTTAGTFVRTIGTSGSGAGELSSPRGVAVSGGEVYVVDTANSRVSVFTTAGAFVRAFGTAGSGAGQLSFPNGVDVAGGEVYVAEANGDRVSVFTTAGVFVRAFGTPGAGAGQLDSPRSVAVAAGEVFVGDRDNDRISVFTTAGAFVRTIGTSGTGAGQIDAPGEVAVAGGELYVADEINDRVSVFTTAGAFLRTLGTGGAAAGQLDAPAGLEVVGGSVYVAERANARVSVLTTDGVFGRAFGRGVEPDGPDVCTVASGCQIGLGTGGAAGRMNAPDGLALAGGEVFVAERDGSRVSVFTTAGDFVRAFGKGVNPGGGDVCDAASGCQDGSFGTAAGELRFPTDVAVSGGEVYVADESNRRVSVFTTAGVFVRAFGKNVNPAGGDVCDVASGCQAGGLGTAAGQLTDPVGVEVADGEVYVAEVYTARVSVFTTAGAFVRAFGKGVDPGGGDVCDAASGCASGSNGGSAGELNAPGGVAVSNGAVYVTELSNDRVSVFTTDGVFVRAFGGDVRPGGGDVCDAASGCQAGSAGGGAAGHLDQPRGVAVAGGEVVVGERATERVSVFTTDGAFVRAFGSTGTAAGELKAPEGVAVAGGEVYVAERGNNRVSAFSVPAPVLSRAPAGVAFGSHDVDDGATTEQSSTLTNDGLTSVTLTGLALTGDAAQFERSTGEADDCAAGTELLPGQTCDVRLRFDPSSVGATAATLTVTSNAASVTVELSGTGVQTEVSLAPTSLSFGSRDVDDGPTAAQTSTVTNTGTEAVTLDGLDVTGDAGQFERLSGGASDCTTATVLDATEACEVRVRFDPSSAGAKAATLTVSSNAADIALALTGTATGADPPPAVVPPPPPGVEPAPPLLPPPAVEPWRLVRRADPVVVRGRRGALTLRSGYVALCPETGPSCVGKFTIKVLRRSRRTGASYKLFLAGRAPLTTVRAGADQALSFRLNAATRRLLRRRGELTVILRGAMTRSGESPPAREARVRLVLPGTGD